ncbi:hypothetical protein Dda_8955 [Drechslerella dactyloides]|uniref:Uncharacterized protein n=1 Tax=Drechslerella dactyloides TaxID=74499 RepID=A0AAD6IQ94_DREDA|nr:hypothetical protein Dda_8955 [Drechslerella dactyloides]
MYRYFMVSAALAKSYWAPFFADGPTAPRIREIFSSRLPSNSDAALDSEYDTLNRVLLIEDLAYFRQWVCYNKNNASENQLRLEFGALAGYLVEREWGKAVPESSSQSRVEGPKKIAGDRDLKEAGAVQTIMMLISCHELWWCTAERQLNKCADFAYRPPLLNPSIEYQKVPAIFLGILSVMDVYIPRNFRGCTQQPAIEFDPRHVGYSVDGVPLRQVRPLRMLQILYQRDFADNPDRSEDLPFELGFFQHVLQHYFGLRVIFSWGYTNTRYSDYVGQGVAFCDADQFMRDIPGFLCKIEAAAD